MEEFKKTFKYVGDSEKYEEYKDKEYSSVEDLAKEMNVSQARIYQMIKDGKVSKGYKKVKTTKTKPQTIQNQIVTLELKIDKLTSMLESVLRCK